MPSRKKAQGKARRIVNEAKAARSSSTKQPSRSRPYLRVDDVLKTIETRESCCHGFNSALNPIIPICSEFIDAFTDAYGTSINCADTNPKSNMITALNAARGATQYFKPVVTDASTMQWVIDYFVALGTDFILEGKDDHARYYAMFANHFEQTIAVIRKDRAEITTSKLAELLNGDMNTVVKYFRQRISCNCLDKKYQEVKSITKQGFCCNPGCSLPSRMVERKKMLRCTQCGESNYCSRECQVAHWSYHKEGCRKYAENKAKCHRVNQSK